MPKSEFMLDGYEIFGWAYECPFKKRKQECSFAEIEQLSFEDKVTWLEDINHIKRESIIKHHLICSQNRDKEEGKHREFFRNKLYINSEIKI